MFLILRLFNSILFLFGNLSIALYTLQRFFRVMKSHYQLVEEVEEYTSLVNQSRASLDYVGSKVMEALKEMEADIGKEVYVTHNLTKLSSKVADVSKRFNELEEGIIELARLSHNMENATVETPCDINEEVRRILVAMKRKSLSAGALEQQPQRSRSPRRAHTGPAQRQTRSHGALEPAEPNPGSKSQTIPSPVSKFSAAAQPRSPVARSPRSRSPGLVPEVMLLDEQRRTSMDKPIGFRPPWMCQV